MGRSGDRAREALLDAAEELFAEHGIDAVSNRRIAEHAGSANHSAVAYHFGTRDDLVTALLERYLDVVVARRAELVAELGPDPSVHDVLRCRILPFVEMLDALPRPSWRARFLAQVRASPSSVDLVARSVRDSLTDLELSAVRTGLAHVPPGVLAGRSGVLGHLVLGICADQEAQMNEGRARGSWRSVGTFLIDAGAGMLTAPVTSTEPAPQTTGANLA